jgi:hypothetical protein
MGSLSLSQFVIKKRMNVLREYRDEGRSINFWVKKRDLFGIIKKRKNIN